MSRHENLKKKLLAKKELPTELDTRTKLSTGSTLLNLACSGYPNWGFAGGLYYHLVGDSVSGKTFLSLACLAEAGLNSQFNRHRFIFDNAENGALMNVRQFFGSAVAGRMEPPAGTRGNPIYSSTLEEFYYHVDDAFKAGKPFIYVLDSTDALGTKDEEDKFHKQKKAHFKDRQEAGTYGTSRAKINSANIRLMHNNLRDEGKSIIILVTQTRANIGFASMLEPRTFSGGKALTFYSALQLWSSVKEHVKVSYSNKQIEQGIIAKVRVKKNRMTGKDRSVLIPILHSSGIDDIGGNCDYLVEWGHWKEDRGKIAATDLGFAGPRESLIRYIERERLEKQLVFLVTDLWNDVEEKCAAERKPKYD